jgi:hypothetical protein
MSYERMQQEEERLREKVKSLLAQAATVDAEEDLRYGKNRRGDELPEELLELIFGYVRDPRLAYVSRAWSRTYVYARAGWQAYLCQWGYASHVGGYRRRCSGCVRVSLDYLRVTLLVNSDIARPWVTRRYQHVPSCPQVPVSPVRAGEKRRAGLLESTSTADQNRKRRLSEDAVPPR